MKLLNIMRVSILLILLLGNNHQLLTQPNLPYWNSNTKLIPWRFVPSITNIHQVDLDKDGDPDIIKGLINDSIPFIWLDDDDDMKKGDLNGDCDNDCLLIDKNIDGIFAGPNDFSLDWYDTNGDGKADIQLLVSNGGSRNRFFYDWDADYMFIMDDDKDQIMHYIDWNAILMKGWEHYGHSNFYEDYKGNSTFLKMHGSSFRIGDLRYNWENPFVFYDTDKDGLTEWAIRLVDTPVFKDPNNTEKNNFIKEDTAIEILFTKKINYAAVTWDLDNDNAAQNEFDFDMSLLFKGAGFAYTDQKHPLNHEKGLPGEDKFFYDHRWRTLDTLYYPGRDTAYSMIFKQGDWQECRLIFDEDDDCNRWERVELYDPKDLYQTGIENGGLDHNKQADAIGDRGEFDLDNSGKGKLYVASFDGRIHLYGAEWGAWRIDQTAFSYQGFGGNYEKWGRERLQKIPKEFAVIKYTDSDANGFIDQILYDLNGDKIFEDSVSFKSLGIDDRCSIFNTSVADYTNYQKLFKSVADNIWQRAQMALAVANKYGIDTKWYTFYQQPQSLHQQYEYGYWLNFYIYKDIRYNSMVNGHSALTKKIDKAFYSGNWQLLLQEDILVNANVVRKLILEKKETLKHPNLFFDERTIAKIKKSILNRDELVMIGYQYHINEADKILKQPLLHYYLDEANLRIPSIHKFAVQLPSLLLAYLLTDNIDYANRVVAQMNLFATYPDWGANRHFLDAGIGGFNFALAYDVLYHYIPDSVKNSWRNVVTSNVLTPAKKQLLNKVWWSTANHNWNGICNGGLIMAALAMFEDNSVEMSEIIALAVNQLPLYLQSFEPDGQSEEGLMYWSYGLMYTNLALESMQRIIGTTFQIDTLPGFHKTPWFPATLSGPVVSINIGDDPIKENIQPSFFWFAHKFKDTALAQWQHDVCLKNKFINWFDFLFYDPEFLKITSKKGNTRSLENYVKGIEVMSIRSGWDSLAAFIAMHGGDNNANHGHLDAGTFEIHAQGEVWAYGNLGRDDYTYPGYFTKKTYPGYFDKPDKQSTPGRWHFYRLRAEGKNCLIINPDTRPDQYELSIARFKSVVADSNYTAYTIDLTDCYQRDASNYQRSIGLNKKSKEIIITDSLETYRPSKLWWQLHTKAKIYISPDSKKALLIIGDKKMLATVLSPAQATFSELPAKYLPGQQFPLTHNSDNQSFKKLIVEIDKFSKGAIRIAMLPVGKDYSFGTIHHANVVNKSHFRLATVLQSNMVMQQAKPITLWGWSKPGTTVSVQSSWHKSAVTVVDSMGRWFLKLPIPVARPGDFTNHSIQFTHNEGKTILKNLLIGEVWLCSGQSNMEMIMNALPPWHKGVSNYKNEIPLANFPYIRLFKVKRETSAYQKDTLMADWSICTPENVTNFSGVAYYFGRKLFSHLNIPIGLVVAAYGGASCQAFMDQESLQQDTLLNNKYWLPYKANPDDKQPHLRPTLVYNAIIHPLIPLSIKGILWYQGESNAGEINTYHHLNAALINSWRKKFNQGKLPFYFVQMTPFNWNKNNPAENKYAKFRETQQRIPTLVDYTDLICTMDIGEPNDIHPSDKKTVGERLAAVALAKTYQRNVPHYGPVFDHFSIEGNEVKVYFKPSTVISGLTTHDGIKPKHFFLSGIDSVFRQADATIIGKHIVLKADSISKPIAVRYAFTNDPVTNLQNKEGWPAYPFRTDNFKQDTLIFKMNKYNEHEK